MLICAWYFDRQSTPLKTTKVDGQKLFVADGDSFAIGAARFRLKGIDAPELHQICKDAQGHDWACGVEARKSLIGLLSEPRLSCDSYIADQYARALAICHTVRSTDIAADQVRAGMAVSDDSYGMRTYGDEEDTARQTKLGIWSGAFLTPSEWRTLNRAQELDNPAIRQ